MDADMEHQMMHMADRIMPKVPLEIDKSHGIRKLRINFRSNEKKSSSSVILFKISTHCRLTRMVNAQSMTIGRRQYPSTDITAPNVTFVWLAIRDSRK